MLFYLTVQQKARILFLSHQWEKDNEEDFSMKNAKKLLALLLALAMLVAFAACSNDKAVRTAKIRARS